MASAHADWKYEMPLCERQFLATICNHWRDEEAFDFSKTGIDPKTRLYLSEDYFFNQEARKLGLETYVLPSVLTAHVGSIESPLSLTALASLGV